MMSNKRGMTLIELVIAMAVAAVILGALTSIFLFANKISIQQRTYAQAQDTVRLAMVAIDQDIRSSSQVLSASTSGSCTTISDVSVDPEIQVAAYCLNGDVLTRNGTTLINGMKSYQISINGSKVSINLISSYEEGELEYEGTIYLRP